MFKIHLNVDCSLICLCAVEKVVFNYLRRRRLFFHCLFFCLCLSVRRITEKVVNGFCRILGGVGHGPRTNEFNFGDRPDPEVRSPKSAFTGISKKLPTDFDEILWRAGVTWPRDQLITFW